MKENNIWLALIEVEPVNNNNDLGNSSGAAFVNVAYKASSQNEFISTVRISFSEYNFKVIQIEDIECYPNLKIDNDEDSEKLSLVEKMVADNIDFCWGLFHTFD